MLIYYEKKYYCLADDGGWYWFGVRKKHWLQPKRITELWRDFWSTKASQEAASWDTSLAREF